MIRPVQLILCLGTLLALTAQAQLPAGSAPANPSVTPGSLIPQSQPGLPPVTFFRNLLAMAPVERARALTNRPPEVRAKIQAKVREYLALDPNERELRLQATELRWFLTPLMRLPPAQRAARLALVPDRWRATVQDRLAQWDTLLPAVQQELLAHDQTLHFFSQVGTNSPAAASPRSEQLAGQFDQYFQLTPDEKKSALNTLSATERAQMEKTLQTFEKLPLAQRSRCLHNYATFAGMSSADRAEFLKNADRWAQMTPTERQAWRDLVAHVPLWPAVPAVIPRQLIPSAQPHPARPSVATNSN